QVFPASQVREEIPLLTPPERRAGQEQIRGAKPGLIVGKALTKSVLGVGGPVTFASAETDRSVEDAVFRIKEVLVFLVAAVKDARPQSVTPDGLRKVVLKRVEIFSVGPRPKIPNGGKISSVDPCSRSVGGSESLVRCG